MVGDGTILTPDSCSASQNTWENVSRVSWSENFFFCMPVLLPDLFCIIHTCVYKRKKNERNNACLCCL